MSFSLEVGVSVHTDFLWRTKSVYSKQGAARVGTRVSSPTLSNLIVNEPLSGEILVSAISIPTLLAVNQGKHGWEMH